MAARASEHLTADPARSSREPVTQRPALHPLLTRGHPSRGTAQFAHRHRLDPQGPPATLRRSMAARQAGPQKPPKAAPPIPETREPGHPRSRHSPCDCPGAHATTERHTLAEEPDECDHHPRQPSRERPTERQPATRQRRLHHLRPQQRPYIIPRNTGKKSPQYSLRDPPSPPDMAKN